MSGLARAAGRGVEAATVKHEVFSSTREAIVSRRLPPGTKLTEDIIAETFACGRGPVRWALARLQDEGLVTLVPNRGAFVAEPAPDEAKNLFGARRVLEGGIVRCLCTAPDRNLKPLIACVEAEDRAQAAGNAEDALRLSGDFHLIMASLTGNPIVETMLREVVSRTILAISAHQRTGTSGCRTHEHHRLIALIEAGDVDNAISEMDAHLKSLEDGLDLTSARRPAGGLKALLQTALRAGSKPPRG